MKIVGNNKEINVYNKWTVDDARNLEGSDNDDGKKRYCESIMLLESEDKMQKYKA
jgi:hypothetical protein